VYNPEAFRTPDVAALRDLMRSIGAGDLITVTPDGPDATLVPWLIDDEVTVLRGHLARANPQWRRADAGTPVLVRFLGPHGYVSPGWYPSKAVDGRVVPTWNYSAVHVRGTLVVHDDAAWVRGLVEELTDVHEARRPQPWHVTDAPADHIERLVRAVVGVEVHVAAVEGKRKLSQNRPEADQLGVVAALERPDASASERALAAAMRRALTP
jgi:transcriptional regulator